MKLWIHLIRDRPFNLQGGGVLVFCFVQKFFFGQHESWNIFFSQNLTSSYMTKTLNQIIFFFLHQNQNIFFSNIGNQNIFFRKKHTPPPPPSFKVNGRSLMTNNCSINLFVNREIIHHRSCQP